MSALFTSRPQAVTLNIRQRASGWLTRLNLHWAGVAVLGLLNLYLLVHMAYAWQTASSQDTDALARQQVELKTAEIARRPLEGLDAKLAASNREADRFYTNRLPANYSDVASELGALAKRTGVRLTRVGYGQAAVSGEEAGRLTEVRMDASLSGDYRSLMLFINGLERDHTFFLITGLTLTGQQTGTVNLRLRLQTYLRGLPGEEALTAASLGPGAETTGGAR